MTEVLKLWRCTECGKVSEKPFLQGHTRGQVPRCDAKGKQVLVVPASDFDKARERVRQAELDWEDMAERVTQAEARLDKALAALREIAAYRNGNPTPRVIAEATLVDLDGLREPA